MPKIISMPVIHVLDTYSEQGCYEQYVDYKIDTVFFIFPNGCGRAGIATGTHFSLESSLFNKI